MDNDLLRKELILRDVDASTDEEIIKIMADAMFNHGYVKEDFKENILKREKEYPTGLNTGEIKVAIPHTDPQYVKKSAIGIAVLNQPVIFKDMGEPDQKIPANIVFMLAVTEPSKQVPLLTKLMSIFSKKEKLESIFHADSDEFIFETVNNLLHFKED